MKKGFFVCSLFFFFAFVSVCWAISISFEDNSYYWPTWGNNTNDDQRDRIGNPDFLSGKLIIDNNGFLEKISIEVDGWNPSLTFADFLLMSIMIIIWIM